MYQTNTAFRLPNTFILDRNRERNAVFYGRVSTEHEAQLAALENQMQWYDDQARYHPNWTVLSKYIDGNVKIGLNQASLNSKAGAGLVLIFCHETA